MASDISSRATIAARAPRASPPPDRVRLSGPSVRLDPRIHAVRRDIADLALAGRVFAPHYARAQPMTATAATMMRAAPDSRSRAVSELLLGEGFNVVDLAGGWAWGHAEADSYVGYVDCDCLAAPVAASHVAVATTLLFDTPDIKSPVRGRLPLGSRVVSDGSEGRFLAVPGGFVAAHHLRALADPEPDFVAVAERLAGTPYLWGGRSGDGIDCSGLVQLALQLAGHAAVPRDSDLQRDALGRPLGDAELARRGDLLFWPGHVGIALDGDRLLHANAHWMATLIEPLADVQARDPGPLLARRRL